MHVRFCTPPFGSTCDVLDACQGCTQDVCQAREFATEALMLVRPLRFVATALAALSLIGLRVVCPMIGPATPPSPGAIEDGRVVFRHYL